MKEEKKIISKELKIKFNDLIKKAKELDIIKPVETAFEDVPVNLEQHK